MPRNRLLAHLIASFALRSTLMLWHLSIGEGTVLQSVPIPRDGAEPSLVVVKGRFPVDAACFAQAQAAPALCRALEGAKQFALVANYWWIMVEGLVVLILT